MQEYGKTFIKYIILISIGICTSFGFVSALPCATCYQMPNELQSYFDGMMDILSILEYQISAQESEARITKERNLNKTADAIQNLDKTQANIENRWDNVTSPDYYKNLSSIQLLAEVLAGNALDNNILTEATANFLIIFNNYPVVRDWKELLVLDEIISDIVLKLTYTSLATTKLNSQDIAKINIALKKLKLIKNIEITDQIDYKNILKFLWQTQAMTKKFYLYKTKTSPFDNQNDDSILCAKYLDFLNDINDTDSQIKIINNGKCVDNLLNYNIITTSYECTRFGATSCDMMNDFMNNISGIMDLFGKDASKIGIKFSKSITLLQSALFETTSEGDYQDYEIKQKELLDDYYGAGVADKLRDYHKNKKGMRGVGMARDATKKDIFNPLKQITIEVAQGLGDIASNIAQSTKKIINSIVEDLKISNEQEIEKIKNNYTYPPIKNHFTEKDIGEFTNLQNNKDYQDQIINAMNSVFRLQDRLNSTEIFADPIPLTVTFPSLSESVYVSIDFINKNENNIIENLKKSLAKQCVNKN